MGGLRADKKDAEPKTAGPDPAPFATTRSTDYARSEDRTPYTAVTHYNNFYELGIDKEEPALYANSLRTRPWTVSFEGEISKPQTVDVDDVLRWFPLEERIYRMRCVEAWSMVIPWVGFPLGDLLRRLEPTSRAKYVAFTTRVKRDIREPVIHGTVLAALIAVRLFDYARSRALEKFSSQGS